MFDVDGMKVSITIGDTGAVKMRGIGYHFSAADRAVFTVKTGNGSVIMQRVYAGLDVDGSFVVYFHSQDTIGRAAGNYSWDVRYLIHPYYDPDNENRIVDADQVITPYDPQLLVLMRTVGDVNVIDPYYPVTEETGT